MRNDKSSRRPWMGYLICFVLGIVVTMLIQWWWHRDPSDASGEQNQPAETRSTQYGNNPHEGTAVLYPGRDISYATKFNDLNTIQLHAAKRVGLKATPLDRNEVEHMRGLLVEVKNTRNYVIDPLSHSVPYLCPNSKAELDRIGEEFADILSRNGLPHYQFIVTSILRTQEDVSNLQRRNSNASENSCHCYGTTFDITYMRFEKAEKSDNYVPEGNLMLVLGQALLNEQRAGHIYVKYERKQACFHITSRL